MDVLLEWWCSMILLASLQQTLLFLPLSFGLFLSYHIAKLTDLTVEASFLTGSAVFAQSLKFMPVSCALLLGVVSGCVTGGFSSLIQRRGRMDSLMASIITVFIFFSVNLLIMDRPHIPLPINVPIWTNACVIGVIMFLLYVLLSSRVGLKLKALGDNPTLFDDLFHARERYRMLGLCISNVLATIAGLMTAMHQGYVDLYMNQGVALLGIGTVLVSTAMTGKSTSVVRQILACVLAVWLYFLISHMFLMFDVSTIYLRVVIGFILIAMLGRKI